MKPTLMKLVLIAFFSVSAHSATALTIDTTGSGNVFTNSGHVRSGQSLTVDATENIFDSIGFQFASAAVGRTFGLSITNALNGGATLFSTSFVVASGLSVVNINQAMTPSSVIFVHLDYLGYSNASVLFNNNLYAGGSSFFLQGIPQTLTLLPDFDLRFVAQFSGVSEVPLPAALPLFGSVLAVAGLLGWRRRYNVAAA